MLKTLNRRLCAQNFVPIWYLSIPNVIFSQIFYSYVYYIAKTYLPLFQHIANSLKKIGLVGTLPSKILMFSIAPKFNFCFQQARLMLFKVSFIRKVTASAEQSFNFLKYFVVFYYILGVFPRYFISLISDYPFWRESFVDRYFTV